MSAEQNDMPWPPDHQWSMFGPNSGGGYSIYFAGGRIWHHRYGDEAGGGQEYEPEPVEDFAENGPKHIVRWLREQGHLG